MNAAVAPIRLRRSGLAGADHTEASRTLGMQPARVRFLAEGIGRRRDPWHRGTANTAVGRA